MGVKRPRKESRVTVKEDVCLQPCFLHPIRFFYRSEEEVEAVLDSLDIEEE